MKQNLIAGLLGSLVFLACSNGASTPDIVTEDIDRFWLAYDQITATTDTAEQYAILEDVFLDPGTPGLEAIMQARRYTPQSYIEAINQYPLFWESIRENTQRAKTFGRKIGQGIDQLKQLYPELKPAKVYFTMGAFRTPGTTMEDLVLIGSELAMADENTVTSEFPERFDYLKTYFAGNPIHELVFLNVHEFVHTQQIPTIGDNLLTQCLYEGVAEFVTVKALGKASPTPAISFGKQRDAAIKESFVKEMFAYSYRNWLWNDANNEFGIRDLGYYVGYATAEKFYEEAEDKQQAIKTLIEIDYRDRAAVEAFVEKTAYFSKPLSQYKAAFEASRPKIIRLGPFNNGDEAVDPDTKVITLEFSAPMDRNSRGFDFGPLGEDNVLGVQKVLGYSDDGRSFSFEADLQPGRRYQVLVSPRFTNEAGIPLQPYLIDIKTADR